MNQETLIATRQKLGEEGHAKIVEYIQIEMNQTVDIPKSQKTKTDPQETKPSDLGKEKIKSITSEELSKWEKNPMEIPNEMIRVLYIQGGLNYLKKDLTEFTKSEAEVIVTDKSDLQLTGTMDETTIQRIKVFQQYANYFKYHKAGQPLNTDGKMNQETMNALVARINSLNPAQSSELLQKAIIMHDAQ